MRWLADTEVDLIALAAAVPDAVAIVDADGQLVGWDDPGCAVG